MALIHQILENTYQSIHRPACLQVVKDLIAVMGLPEDTGLEFFGSHEAMYQYGSTLERPLEAVKFSHFGKVTIEASESVLEQTTLTQSVKRQHNTVMFFRDIPLDVFMRPVYSQTEVKLSWRYRAPDRSTADSWRHEMEVRSSMWRESLLHKINYHYLVPYALMAMVIEIHRLRENVGGYGQTVGEWCKHCFSDRATVLTNLGGEQPRIAITEQQNDIIGQFDWVSSPEVGSKDGDSSAWLTGFDYTFVYDKPVAVVMGYPLVVHNQLLPERCRPVPAYDNSKEITYPSVNTFLFRQMAFVIPNALRGLRDLRIPHYDDWIPAYNVPNIKPILQVLLQVDEKDPQDVFPLTDLGDYAFSPEILELMRSSNQYLTTVGESILHVGLWRCDRPAGQLLRVDTNLAVKAVEPLSLREMYHVHVSLCVNFHALSKRAIDAMSNHGVATYQILLSLCPVLVQRWNMYINRWPVQGWVPGVNDLDYLPKLITGKVLRRRDLEVLLGLVTQFYRPSNGQNPSPWTVWYPTGDWHTYQTMYPGVDDGTGSDNVTVTGRDFLSGVMKTVGRYSLITVR